MDTTADIAKAKDILEKAQDVLIVTHENPTEDSIGSTLALYLGLTSLGKKVTVACPDPITVALSDYIGVNKVTQDLGKKNFVIALDYVDGSIEKVSYNIEGDKFNLVVEPRPGYEPFSAEKVHYSYGGAAADVIISVDTIHLGGLKRLYEADRELYASKTLVNIDRHPNNAHYGQINIVDGKASSTVELVTQMLSTLGVRLTEDIATNILNAVYAATDDFQSGTITAFAFEVAAACVKAGGRRFSKVRITEELPKAEAVPPVQGTPIAQPKQVQEQKPRQQRPAEAPSAGSGQGGQTPSDWLKPKIFKSSNIS